MLRNKYLQKVVVVFMLLTFTTEIFFPTVSYALTNGPSQPEYTNYESAETTDVVNLLTGDLTYSIPLVNLPGPGGGFTMPLAYHSGLTLEHEASWVGLGWSLNPGAIARSVNQYHDDAWGDLTNSNDKLVVHVENTGGYGYSNNYILFQTSYDSNKGYGGSMSFLDLTIGWDEKGIGSSIGFAGVTYNRRNKDWDIDVFQVGCFVVSTAMTFGAGNYINSWASFGQAAAGDLMGKAISAGIGITMGGYSNSSVGYMGWRTSQSGNFFKQKYKYWLDGSRDEGMFGTLYLAKMRKMAGSGMVDQPRVFTDGQNTNPNSYHQPQLFYYFSDWYGVGSDMHIDYDNSDYRLVANPTSLAHDSYSVMGQDISGNIQPYHLSVGSLATPRKMSSVHQKIDLIPFLDNKVQFRYLADFSNKYTYHKGDANDQFGFNHKLLRQSGSTMSNLFYEIFDNTLKNRYTGASDWKEKSRYGLTSDRLVHGKHIDWYNNEEIKNGTPITKGFLDFLPSSQRTTFRNGCPNKGIGGFSVTAENGVTYHYALPVYNFAEYSKQYEDGTTNYNSIQNFNPYAHTWLLTAITGPDFIDRGEVGILDDADYGYWVKLEYGNFSSQYKWRVPYNYDGASPESATLKTFSEGYRNTYYLDKVSTKTHTALFVKDVRNDARSHYRGIGVTTSNLGINEEFPSSSLSLKEIFVMTNEDYNKLTTANGVGIGVPAFGKSSGGTLYGLFRTSDMPNNVIDVNDISANANYRTFLESNSLNRILFNYSYNLCKGAPNSFTPEPVSSGKLTLESVSLFAQNNNKIMPDYKFYYGNNVNYDQNKWDGWGTYKTNGDQSLPSWHGASAIATDGYAWTLNKIQTPLGATIDITYERDDYSKVAENILNPSFNISAHNLGTGAGIPPSCNCLGPSSSGTRLTKYFSTGQTLTLSGFVHRYYGPLNPDYHDPYTINVTIASLTDDKIVFSENLVTLLNLSPLYNLDPVVQVTLNGQTLSSKTDSRYGGDLRVAELKISDNISSNKTRYFYTENGDPNGVSSGVVSREPEFIGDYQYPFYKFYDWPSTPVIYKTVTVLNGQLSTNTDYVNKTVYNFEMPHSNMISYVGNTQIYDGYLSDIYYPTGDDLMAYKKYKYIMDIKTSKIGQLKSIATYDKTGAVKNSTTLIYTEPDYQGVFTEGTILSEMVGQYNGSLYFHKLFRTTKTYYPSVLTEVQTNNNGITTSSKNTLFDFISGKVIEKEYVNSLGVKYGTIEVPAYERYSDMGPKAISLNNDNSNKNMLFQTTGQYLYKYTPGAWTTTPMTLTLNSSASGINNYTADLGSFPLLPTYRAGYWCGLDAMINGVSTYIVVQIKSIATNRKSFTFDWGGTLSNPAKLGYGPNNLVSVGIQTWDNNWSERKFKDDLLLFYNEPISSQKIWREKASYTWNSTKLNSDGTFNSFKDFDWTLSSQGDDRWLKTGEALNYDPYSRLIESRGIEKKDAQNNDVSWNFSSTGYGYNQKYPLFSVANANNYEAAYSGAEDLGVPYASDGFGGEFVRSAGTIEDTKAHTGKNSLKLTTSQYGFIHKARVEPFTELGKPVSGIKKGRTYKASVWVHKDSDPTAQLYWHMQTSTGVNASTSNAGAVTLSSMNNVAAIGNWKLLQADITITGDYPGYLFVVGCTNQGSTPSYFDDIRLHPIESSMTTNVYDSRTGLITHVLDENNFYTRYVYDSKNRISEVYKETIKGEIKKNQYTYNFGRGNN